MQFIKAFATSALVAGALAYPSSNHVLHEKRSAPSTGKGARVERDAIIPLRIALKQTGLEHGYDRLMDVASPSSKSFGKHWTAEEVYDAFAPSEESVQAVKDWLMSAGVAAEEILPYKNKGWIGADMPAEAVEKLLKTQYHEHETKQGLRLGCDEYYLPSHVAEHVDFVKPGVIFSAPLKKRTIEKRQTWSHGHGHPPGGPGWWPGPGHAPHNPHWQPPSGHGLPPELRSCALNMTPTCLKAMYHIPTIHYAQPENIMGLYETYDAFSQQDIDLFFASFAPWVPQGTTPDVKSVDGGTAPVSPGSVRNGGESDIDLDLSYSLIYPQTVTLYQVDDLPNSSGETNVSGFLNTFLDSVDGSYCDYTAYGITGDTPGVDAQYPDTNYTNGYKGQLECGTYSLTRVLSISYGEAEIYLPKNYVERQCNEFMKLGLQGHSIFVASGDYGVASFPGSNGDAYGCLNGTIYNPDYPSGCPYITTVGQTRYYPNQTILDRESAGSVDLNALRVANGLPNDPPLAFFGSGGGFSNYFTPPSYQAAAVKNYLANYSPDVPYYVVNADATNIGENGGVYNRAGRGYPDVSANGAFLLAYNNLTLNNWFGTSLASPIFGSVVTLLNEERTQRGKGPIGFINPTLYEHPYVLNDIVNGSNPNCGSSGFTTAPGWDPVTGLGTPNYDKMRQLFVDELQ